MSVPRDSATKSSMSSACRFWLKNLILTTSFSIHDSDSIISCNLYATKSTSNLPLVVFAKQGLTAWKINFFASPQLQYSWLRHLLFKPTAPLKLVSTTETAAMAILEKRSSVQTAMLFHLQTV